MINLQKYFFRIMENLGEIENALNSENLVDDEISKKSEQKQEKLKLDNTKIKNSYQNEEIIEISDDEGPKIEPKNIAEIPIKEEILNPATTKIDIIIPEKPLIEEKIEVTKESEKIEMLDEKNSLSQKIEKNIEEKSSEIIKIENNTEKLPKNDQLTDNQEIIKNQEPVVKKSECLLLDFNENDSEIKIQNNIMSENIHEENKNDKILEKPELSEKIENQQSNSHKIDQVCDIIMTKGNPENENPLKNTEPCEIIKSPKIQSKKSSDNDCLIIDEPPIKPKIKAQQNSKNPHKTDKESEEFVLKAPDKNSRKPWNGPSENFLEENLENSLDLLNDFKEIQKEFPTISKSDIEKMQNSLKTVPSDMRKILLRNECFYKICMSKFESAQISIPNAIIEYKQKLINSNSNEQNEYKFEISLHKDFLVNFKTTECEQKDDSEHEENCRNFHNKDDMRRKPILYFYKSGIWNYYPIKCEQNECKLGRICRYAHNNFEILYHPLLYKTSLCASCKSFDMKNTGELPDCPNNSCECSYAHSIEDLRDLSKIYNLDIEKIQIQNETIIKNSVKSPAGMRIFNQETYKTFPCPDREECKNKECLNYHNALERRRPSHYKYRNEMCPKVYKDNKFLNPLNCINKDYCQFCHTKNEFYYHKENYRKKICTRNPCRYGEKYCPDIHERKIEKKIEPSLESENQESKSKFEKLKSKLTKIQQAIVFFMRNYEIV